MAQGSSVAEIDLVADAKELRVNGQCARVLEVLSDGQPHSVSEIHRRAGTMRLNSRVAELRRHLKERGETIVCTRTGGNGPDSYLYTLSSLRAAGPQQGTGHPAARSDTADRSFSPAGPGHALTPASSGPAPDVELQLELDWIDQELDQPIVLDSENARGRRESLRRQRRILEGKFA